MKLDRSMMNMWTKWAIDLEHKKRQHDKNIGSQPDLQIAAKARYMKVIKKLLIAKANVNTRTMKNSGSTTLQAATKVKHFEVIEKLLTAKTDMNNKAVQVSSQTAL